MHSPAPSRRVFISVGHGLSLTQDRFVTSVDALLGARGFEPVTPGRTTGQHADPLAAIRDAIEGSDGTLVIAFKRLAIASATEYPDADQVAVPPRVLSTVWNQIEAAMTYQAAHPLLILAEDALHPEGLIDRTLLPQINFSLTADDGSLPEKVRCGIERWLATLDLVR
jgi:hypothetical protein